MSLFFFLILLSVYTIHRDNNSDSDGCGEKRKYTMIVTHANFFPFLSFSFTKKSIYTIRRGNNGEKWEYTHEARVAIVKGRECYGSQGKEVNGEW